LFVAEDAEIKLPSQQVVNFALKMLCFICANEWSFVEIKEKGLLEKIKNGIEKHEKLQRASIKLSHLQLLHAISQHSIGLHFIRQTKIWNLIIDYYQHNNTIYFIREASSFFFNILTKFSQLMKDEEACIEVLYAIMSPIINYKKYDKESIDTPVVVDDENFAPHLMPCIDICSQILRLCSKSNKRSRIAYYILLKYRFENKLWIIQDAVQTDLAFLTSITRALNISNFTRLSSMDIPSDDTKSTDLTFDLHAIHFYNLQKFCAVRRIFRNINMICEMHHQLWYELGERAPKEVVLENHDLKMGDQVIMIQTFPVVYLIKSRYKPNDEYINQVCSKMFHKSCEHTIRLLYQYRDALSYESFEFVADLASNSVHSIIATKNFLNRDRATLGFQILIYILKGYVEDPMEGEGGSNQNSGIVQLVLQAPNLLSTLLNALNEMIKTFNFTWKECIESTTIAPLLLTLLENPNLSARVSKHMNITHMQNNAKKILIFTNCNFFSKRLKH
jgi:hypothetical protein